MGFSSLQILWWIIFCLVCVCVWNIWTDVKLLIRIVTAGGGSRVQSLPPTKTLWSPWWYMAWSAMRTCNFSNFPSHGNRLSLQPDIRFFCTAFAIWWLFLHWLFGWLSMHFSPFQNAELWMNFFDLGLILPFTLTSWVFRCLLRRGLLGIYD